MTIRCSLSHPVFTETMAFVASPGFLPFAHPRGTLLSRRPRMSSAQQPSDAKPEPSQTPPPSLQSRRHRARFESSKKGLEMAWRFNVQDASQTETCPTCRGKRAVECPWCHATGALMLGDRMMCSIEGHSQCLVCQDGEVECKACKGTGRLASWIVLDS